MPGKEIKGRSKIANYRHGGRIKKQIGGVTRRDERSGYYPSDMGMAGGAMYKKGGKVKKKNGK